MRSPLSYARQVGKGRGISSSYPPQKNDGGTVKLFVQKAGGKRHGVDNEHLKLLIIFSISQLNISNRHILEKFFRTSVGKLI
jgi:hypothetical protein